MNQTERTKLKERLEKAEDAYDRLMCGEKEVVISYDGNRSVTYNQISVTSLAQYIVQLKAKLGMKGGRRRAIGVSF